MVRGTINTASFKRFVGVGWWRAKMERLKLQSRGLSGAETLGMEGARTLTSSFTSTMAARGFQYVENAGVKFVMVISNGVRINAQKVLGRRRSECTL
jgi:hypothetical protein